jgi:hypothetical protein
MADTRGPLCMLQACVPPQRFLHAERDHLYYLCPPPYLSIRGKRCTLVATTQPSLATRVLRLRTYAMAEAGHRAGAFLHSWDIHSIPPWNRWWAGGAASAGAQMPRRVAARYKMRC